MAMYLIVPEQTSEFAGKPLTAEQLLRRLGVTGRLAGFRYTVSLVEQVAENPECIRLITKRLYPDTARQFGVTASSLERSVRTLVRICWEREEHEFLDHIAGCHVERRPSNTEFIDVLASYLRQNQ